MVVDIGGVNLSFIDDKKKKIFVNLVKVIF